MRPSRTDYQVQVCDLPDHFEPHEGSWAAYGPAYPTRREALGRVKEALTVYSHVRLLTREVYT